MISYLHVLRSKSRKNGVCILSFCQFLFPYKNKQFFFRNKSGNWFRRSHWKNWWTREKKHQKEARMKRCGGSNCVGLFISGSALQTNYSRILHQIQKKTLEDKMTLEGGPKDRCPQKIAQVWPKRLFEQGFPWNVGGAQTDPHQPQASWEREWERKRAGDGGGGRERVSWPGCQ